MSANKMFHRFAPLALSAAVVFAIPACKKQEAAPAAGPQAASTTAASTAPAAPVVSAAVAQMTPEQLRDAARKAYDDNRLYAPTGNNAMEYYLALRDKQPGDASASSALSDLLPMAVIATEQGIAREDFDEAKRLVALIGKADPNHPALARLKASIDKGVALAAQRAQQQQLTAEQEAKLKEDQAKQREEDQKKLQEQQRQLAAQQAQQAQQAAAADQQRQAAEAEAQRRAAAQAAAAAAAAPTPAAPAPAAPRPTASNSLQVVSQASPRFPPAAQRAGAKGSVQVEFTVGSDGSVTGARVVSSDVPRQFARDFEREALSAVKRWRFQPINQATTTRRTISFD
ncbi:MAG: energy transducer TonB [Proteobacteria bacterium]|nr:energy transducer TonB [Pseudomonadota bacterium]